ncbi:basic proline-rich protein-like [Harpia harpyja]|uniref:basic proline-rich protein-like n=1 Tax=Harpia harpyja TaxID=202280 RepID=UPI0022B16004|nr:basic proline-rich protein-like [Harpia harpyja]
MPGRAEGLNPGGNQFPPKQQLPHTPVRALPGSGRAIPRPEGFVLPAAAPEKSWGEASSREEGAQGQEGSPAALGDPQPCPGPLLAQGTRLGARTGSRWRDRAGADPVVETRSCRGPPAPKAELQLLPPRGDPRESVPRAAGKVTGPQPGTRGGSRTGAGGRKANRSPAAASAGRAGRAATAAPVALRPGNPAGSSQRGACPRSPVGPGKSPQPRAGGSSPGRGRGSTALPGGRGSCPQAGHGPKIRAAPNGQRPVPPLPQRSQRAGGEGRKRPRVAALFAGFAPVSPASLARPRPGTPRPPGAAGRRLRRRFPPAGRRLRPPRAGTVRAAAGAAPEEPRGDGTPGYSGTLAPARSTGGETRRRHREQPWRGSSPSTIPGLPETGPEGPGPGRPPAGQRPGSRDPASRRPRPRSRRRCASPAVPRRRRPLAAGAGAGVLKPRGGRAPAPHGGAPWRPRSGTAAPPVPSPVRPSWRPGATRLAALHRPSRPHPTAPLHAPPGHSPTCLPIIRLRLPLLRQ